MSGVKNISRKERKGEKAQCVFCAPLRETLRLCVKQKNNVLY